MAPDPVSVLLGEGGGKLAARADFATVGTPTGIALGDLNADGRLDIAVVGRGGAQSSAGRVSVLLGAGSGKFAAHADYVVGMNPQAVAFGDVNGDGKPDLVVANAGSEYYWSLSVLLGKGDGTLAPSVDYPSGWGPMSIALVDLNGDGKLDIIAGNSFGEDSSVSVLLGRGDGTFPAKVDYPGPAGLVSVGDVNGDGKLDISTESSVLLGAGDGAFPSRFDYLPIGRSFVLGDMNGDGRPDLVGASYLNSVVVLLNSCP